MTTQSELAVLQLLHLPGVGPRMQGKVLALAAEKGISVADILALEPGELTRVGLGKLGATSVLNEARERAKRLQQALAEHEIRILVKGQDDYPSALLRGTGGVGPPVLFARGPVEDVLSRPGVAFSGSRHASKRGLTIASFCSGELAREGVNVISGFARGVDLSAHTAALDAGGTTTFVLAEGILRFRPKPDLTQKLTESKHLILSQFPPEMSWTAGNAMQRNRVLLGLAKVVVVVESGLDGGTFAAGETALAMGQPIFVVDYPDPPDSAAGNRVLLNRGAQPLTILANGRPDLAPLLELIATANRSYDRPVVRRNHQPSLFALPD